MTDKKFIARVTAMAVLTLLVHASSAAEPYYPNANDLLVKGDSWYETNCVTGSKFYFAYLQREKTISATRRKLINQRIESCETGSVIAGNMTFYDLKIPMPLSSQDPKTRRCNAYADLAMTQQRINTGMGCGNSGHRWSSNFDVHFKWCMDQKTQLAELRTESDTRQGMLDNCIFK